jgi:hypothetical protein
MHLKGTLMECHSAQEWMACADCASLIDAQRWDALSSRAARLLAKHYGVSGVEISSFRTEINQLHGAFRRHFIAEA